jgi:hypothetical protein
LRDRLQDRISRGPLLAQSPNRRAIRQLHDVLAFVISLDCDLPTPFRLERKRLQDRLGALWLPKILSRRSIAFQSGKLPTEWSVF